MIQFAIVQLKYGNVQPLCPFGNGKNEPYEDLKISRQVGANQSEITIHRFINDNLEKSKGMTFMNPKKIYDLSYSGESDSEFAKIQVGAVCSLFLPDCNFGAYRLYGHNPRS